MSLPSARWQGPRRSVAELALPQLALVGQKYLKPSPKTRRVSHFLASDRVDGSNKVTKLRVYQNAGSPKRETTTLNVKFTTQMLSFWPSKWFTAFKKVFSKSDYSSRNSGSPETTLETKP